MSVYVAYSVTVRKPGVSKTGTMNRVCGSTVMSTGVYSSVDIVTLYIIWVAVLLNQLGVFRRRKRYSGVMVVYFSSPMVHVLSVFGVSVPDNIIDFGF